mgnify:CR=1 FL=1
MIQLALVMYFYTPDSDGSVRGKWLRHFKTNIRLYARITNNVLCEMVLPVQSLEDFDNAKHHKNPKNRSVVYFYRSRNLALNWLLMLILLFSFGLAYPPLAVMLLISVVTSTLVLQLCVHLHHQQVSSLPESSDCIGAWNEVLIYEMWKIDRILLGSYDYLILFSNIFLSMFLCDMAGYSVETIVLVLMLLISLSLFRYCYYIYKTYVAGKESSPRSLSLSTVGLSMNTRISEFLVTKEGDIAGRKNGDEMVKTITSEDNPLHG